MWKLVVPVLAALFTASLGALVGGLRDLDINDEGAKSALNFAVVHHNRGTNDLYLSDVAEVVKVQSQVVAGIKYFITVKMGKTTCRKDSANEVCGIPKDPEQARPYLCTFTVWSRPWLREISVLEEKCNVGTLQ